VPRSHSSSRSIGPAGVARISSASGRSALPESCRCLPRPVPGGDSEFRVGQRRRDELGDEAIDPEPMSELRMRAPVLAPLPEKLLALEIEAGGDEERARFVEQPVRLWLARAKAGGRVEAVEHPVAVEEEQAVLRPTAGAEEEQPELVGRQHLLVVKAERELPVALCQVTGELEEVLGAHAPSTPSRSLRTRITIAPSLSDFDRAPDHAASRPFRRCSGNGITPPIAPPKTPPKAPGEVNARRFRTAASSSSSTNSATASCSCSMGERDQPRLREPKPSAPDGGR
jgi:hypothetical protein